jgi:hypothetical protein
MHFRSDRRQWLTTPSPMTRRLGDIGDKDLANVDEANGDRSLV